MRGVSLAPTIPRIALIWASKQVWSYGSMIRARIYFHLVFTMFHIRSIGDRGEEYVGKKRRSNPTLAQ